MIYTIYRWMRAWSIPAFFSYVLCSFLFTCPLIFRLSTHVPGEVGGDIPVYIWNLWWMEKSLFAGSSPLFSDFIFAPQGVSLTFHAFVFLKALLAIPLQGIFSSWTTYNILILATFSAAGFGMYLLARYLTGSAPAAWVAGLVYGFSPFMLARGLGHLNYLSGEWMPLYILCLLRLIDAGERRWAVGAGIFLLLTAYCEYYYLIYLALFTVLYLGYRAWRTPEEVLRRDFLVNCLLMGGIAVVGFSPILWALFGVQQSGFIYGGWGGSAKLGADLLAFFTPPPGSLLYRDVSRELFVRFSGGNVIEATVFTGYIVLGLAAWCVLRLRREEKVRPWLWLWLIFFLLSLGPLLHVGGDFVFGFGPVRFAVPLPYIAVHYLPLIKGARVPARFDIMIELCLAVLCAFALRYRLRSIARVWPVALGIASLVALEYLRLPYPTSAVEIPAIYRQIADDQRDVVVMEVPLGWRTGWGSTGRSFDEQQLYQIVHGKRLIGGFASRVPESQLEAMAELPALPSLLALQEEIPMIAPLTAGRRGEIREQMKELIDHLPSFVVERVMRDPSVRKFMEAPATVAEEEPRVVDIDRKEGLELVARTGLGYVVVHPPYSRHGRLVDYLEGSIPLQKIYETDGVVGFKVVH